MAGGAGTHDEEESPFLFVNQGPDNFSSKVSNRKTRAHVQGQHQWRVRLQDRPTKRQTTKPSPRNPQAISGLSNQRGKKQRRPNQDRNDGEERKSLPTHPVTILQKGNSDPFDATTVRIDPQVNDILLFYRDCLLPAMYALETNSTPKAQGLRNWQDSASALHEQCTAYSFLARSALLMSASDPPESKLAMQAVAWKVKASAILRTQLVDEANLDEHQTHRSMFHLLITEVFAKNTAGAAVHAKMLSCLLMKYKETHPLDLRFLYKVAYNDFQRASMCLERPAFDFDIWIPQQFGPSWQRARSSLPLLKGTAFSGLDSSIEDEKLRDILVWHRELMEFVGVVTRDASVTNSLTWPFLSSRATCGQARLVDHSLDQVALVKSNDDTRHQPLDKVRESIAVQDAAWISAYTALAALYWTRAVSRIENISVGRTSTGPVSTIYEAGPTILAAMKNALIASEASHDLKRDRIRLWALYVGALGEQTNSGESLDACKSWFNVHFAKQARAMKLLAWNEVKEPLKGFLYTDHLRPHGSQWFFKIMR